MQAIDRIQELIQGHPVVAFVRGTVDRPMCLGSENMLNALEASGAYYLAIDIQADPELRAFLPRVSNRTTFPQLFVEGDMIGGADVVVELHAQGDLGPLCNDAVKRLRKTA